MSKKELAKKEDVKTPAAVYDYAEYAGAGFEKHTRDDYAVPFLGVLQSNSPQIETLPSARPGMLFNTVTNELYDAKKGIVFIPAETQHNFIEWRPRDQGGGFVSSHALGSELVKKAKDEQEFGKYKVVKGQPKSNDLIETYYVYGILVKEDGTSEKMIIAFTSTKNKIYKQWMTKARTIQVAIPDGRRITAPLFAHKYRITSVGQKNAKGSFFNFQVAFDGAEAVDCRLGTTDPLFLEAVAFRELVQSDGIKAAHETQAPGNDEEESTATPFA
jgi:hypothetical protein